MNPVELARPEIRALQPYSSARMEAYGGSVWLNANESPWPPRGGEDGWNRYPDPQPAALLTTASTSSRARPASLTTCASSWA